MMWSRCNLCDRRRLWRGTCAECRRDLAEAEEERIQAKQIRCLYPLCVEVPSPAHYVGQWFEVEPEAGAWALVATIRAGCCGVSMGVT
jgi:hypothetical protein